MHSSEMERLLEHLTTQGQNPELDRLTTAEAWQTWARDRGYRVSLAEARELLDSRSELGEDELEQVAGGWDGTTPPPPEETTTSGSGGG